MVQISTPIGAERWKLNQTDLADQASIGISTVHRMEHVPFESRIQTAQRLADAHYVRVARLLTGDEPMVGLVQLTVKMQSCQDSGHDRGHHRNNHAHYKTISVPLPEVGRVSFVESNYRWSMLPQIQKSPLAICLYTIHQELLGLQVSMYYWSTGE